MITALAAVLAVLFFLAAFTALGVIPVARDAITQSRAASAVIRDPALTDEQKEERVQRAALSLLGCCVSILLRSALCLLASAIPVYALARAGLTSTDEVLVFMSRWDFIALSSIAIGLAMYLVSTRKKAAVDSDYSGMDRALHKLAFYKPFVQLTAADMEDNLYRKALDAVADQPPIFITSLPRAGTTILLTAMNHLPGTATHTYRDMPFVMAPLLWSRFSKNFSNQSELKERAHGDGIQVGQDSPEAFEEVLWRHFWPGNYQADHIDLWSTQDANPEATAFFRSHFRKISLLRSAGNGRYVSKNNGNIARLDLIPEMFPGAHIVVPVRQPLEQAASLLRQHRNFLDQHDGDPFIERYMHDIGHLEFGQLHKPFAFPGFDKLATGLDPQQADYWLAYWIAGMRTVLERADRLLIVPQEKLSRDGQQTMVELCRQLGLDPGEFDLGSHFRSVETRAIDEDYSAALRAEAEQLYDRLMEAASRQVPDNRKAG